jgi:hypothetical protein
MPLNFYSFLIANMLAEREFEAKQVPNKARSQQLGLVASVFSPSGSGGGLGSSVLPAVLVQQTARREAEAAASTTASLSTASGTGGTATTGGGTTTGTGGGTTGTGGGTTGTGGGTTGTGAVTRDEFQALTVRVSNLEGLLVDYHDVKDKTFAEAKTLLKDFHVLTVDEVMGQTIDDSKQIVSAQFPEFRPGMKLLRGMLVALLEDASRLRGRSEQSQWGEKG